MQRPGQQASRTHLPRSRVTRIHALLIAAFLGAACGGDPVTAPATLQLDLASALRQAERRANPAGRLPAQREQALWLPPNSRISYAIRVPVAGELRFASVELPSGRSASLRLVPGEGGEEIEIPLTASNTPTSINLSPYAGEIMRLVIEAHALSAIGQPGPIKLRAPHLFGRGDPEQAGHEGGTTPPNVIIYLIDTLRPDHLGIYGYEKDTSPNIDAFARNAVVFDEAIAQAPWTKTSVASMFTGLWARSHGVLSMGSMLPQAAFTLAEFLQDAGYQTGGVVANGLIGDEFGFEQGFDFFERVRGRAPGVPGLEGPQADKPAIDSDVAQAVAWRWLDTLDRKRPFFLYVHTLDPHAPHFPPEPFKSRFVPDLDRADLGSMESVRALSALSETHETPPARVQEQLMGLYDAEIAHNDEQFGAFIEGLKARGLYDDTLIILLSDHGEGFWEHELRGHGNSLHGELLRIPLIIKTPSERQGVRSGEMVQHVDLLPTIADYAGLYLFENLHGRSLRPVLRDAQSTGPPRQVISYGAPGTSVRDGHWKLIRRNSNLHPLELYDLAADPREMKNVARDHPIVARYLLESLARYEAAARPIESVPDPEMSTEMRAELEALGYIQ